MYNYKDVLSCVDSKSNWRNSDVYESGVDYDNFESMTHELAHVCSIEPESLVSEVFARNITGFEVANLLRKSLPQIVEQDRNEYIVSAAVYLVSKHFGADDSDMEVIFENLRSNLVLLTGSNKEARVKQYCEQYFSHPEVKFLAAGIIKFYDKLVTLKESLTEDVAY